MTSYGENEKVTAYIDGVLVWGQEPSGTTPAPTSTPTVTVTPTPTPTPTVTPTPTPTPGNGLARIDTSTLVGTNQHTVGIEIDLIRHCVESGMGYELCEGSAE